MRLFLFVLLTFGLISCGAVKDGKPSIKQGVFGRTMWLQGNLMPSPDAPKSNGAKAVVRTVYIYKLSNLKHAIGESPLFTKVNTALVAKVKTDSNGYFQCQLESGNYSIFTEEVGGKLFANLFDGDGAIMPFEVKHQQVTRVDIQINYKAFY